MTNCEQIWDDLKAYSDGELPILARLRVRRHVLQCAACREEITAMELIRRRLRQNDAPAFTPELKDKILAGIPEGVPPIDETLPVRNKKKPMLIFGATAAAAMSWFLFYPMTQKGLMPEGSMADKSVVHAFTGGASNSVSSTAPEFAAKSASPQSENAPMVAADSAMAGEAKEERAKGYGGGEAIEKAATAQIPQDVSRRRFDAEKSKAESAPASSAPAGAPADKSVARQTVLLTKRDIAGLEIERQVHRDASLTVQVDSAEAKSEKVETLLKAEGGYVADSNLNTLDDGTKSSIMTLKVPVDKFESFMATLSKLGEVKAKSVSGEDLTERISDEKQGKRVLGEEIQDTQARLNQRRQTKAQERQDREDLRELKTRIAVKQARLDLYKKMATLSNISLTLSEKPKNPPPTPAPQSGFMHDLKDTAADAGQAFLQAAKLPFVLLIWIAVYSPVWLILLAGYRYFVVRG